MAKNSWLNQERIISVFNFFGPQSQIGFASSIYTVNEKIEWKEFIDNCQEYVREGFKKKNIKIRNNSDICIIAVSKFAE